MHGALQILNITIIILSIETNNRCPHAKLLHHFTLKGNAIGWPSRKLEKCFLSVTGMLWLV